MAIDLARIEDWLTRRALPLWAGPGWDAAHGGFYDHLTLTEPAPVLRDSAGEMAKRLRVQARQIYVYSHAGLLGLDPAGAGRAARGVEFMTAHYWHEAGGWIFSVGADGAPVERRRDLYEQAFALFALAWAHRATGAAGILDWVARTVEFLDTERADTVGGGYWEVEPERRHQKDPPPRQQNPHMHLLEAWLALHEATGETEYLARATDLVGLFEARFVDRETGALAEFFADDWTPAPGAAGDIVEPGHLYEWAWLLARYGRAAGRDMSAMSAPLYRFAERHGIDADGLAFDRVSRAGSVLIDTKRLWVQTEALKASAARYEAAGETADAARVEVLLDRLFALYLDEATGHWRDRLARDGTCRMDTAPASSFYHVFLALTEIMRIFGADGDTNGGPIEERRRS